MEHRDYRLVMGVALECSDLPLLAEMSKQLAPAELMHAVQQFLPNLAEPFKARLLDFVVGRMEGGAFCLKEGDFLTLLGVYRLLNRYEDAAKMIYEQVKRGNKELSYTIALEAS